MKKNLMISIVVILVSISSAIVPAAERDPEYDYVFGIHFASTGGRGSSQYYDLVSTMLEIAEKEYGYKLKLQNYNSEEEVLQAFIDNEIDMAKMFFDGVVKIREAGGEIYPWGTYVMKKDRKEGMCFWRRKDAEPVNKDNISGKIMTLTYMDYNTYLGIRDHLADNGIDEPLWQVFGGFLRVPGANSAYMALASGKGDVLWSGEDQKQFLKVFFSNVYAKLDADFCTDQKFGRGMLAINKKTVTPEKIKLADEALETLTSDLSILGKKYPKADFIAKFLKMAKIRGIHATSREFEYEEDLLARSKENGWLDEAIFFTSQILDAPLGKEFQMKPDMEYCKKICSGDSNCVLSCLE